MRHRLLSRFIAGLCAFVLLTAACGSSSSETSTEGSTDTTAGEESSDTTVTEESPGTTEAGGESTEQPKEDSAGAGGLLSVDEQVALLTSNVESEEWGIKDGVLTGPSGYTIDLNSCGDEWSDTAGISDAEILLGSTVPHSGTVAIYGQTIDGARAYYDSINEVDGGIGGRAITLIDKDDAYEPARAVSNVQELLQRDDVFAIVGAVGTPGNLAVYDDLNDKCVPHLFPHTGHPAWGDPVNHPWSIPGIWIPYNTEGLLWGQYLKQEFPEGVSVAALVLNNDAGIAWEDGFKTFADQNPDIVTSYKTEKFEASAPNYTNEMTTLLADKPDVFINMGGGISCPGTMDEVAKSSAAPKVNIVPNVCASVASFFEPAGENGRDWILLQALKDLGDSRWESDPFVKEASDVLTETGLDPSNGMLGLGIGTAQPMVQAMQIADQMPGGLSRSNLMLALRTTNTEHPLALPGATWHADGAEDAYYMEAGQFVKYVLADGEEIGTFEPIGEVFDVDGETPQCVFADGKCG